ncbi:hypothetical protein VSS74_06505 [Conexibacter stalactiti]|uniref:N-acetyltransferase domain-containing protein n=1 Tax=Conexibacter stalactiti TaxID=1940611 RepID=A0ABU4HKX5_9ACTN|nr:hypothetical protein [Conexibacter stalactiti]MDW5593976.1 hypothetical protein [Conexibacter stalactiti]MEC5034618.1 hypothetical protein [Conexibacter stalactiti]
MSALADAIVAGGLSPALPMRELEAVEIAGYRDQWSAVPPVVAERYGVADATLPGGIHCLTVADQPGRRVVNHALGIDPVRPLAPRTLDAIERFFAVRGLPALAAVAEGAPAERQLHARGWRRDVAWMKFARAVDAPLPLRGDCPFEIQRVPLHDRLRLGELLARAFELPAGLAPWLGAIACRPGWECLGAYAGERLVATGSLYVAGGAGWVTWGATDPAARGQGAQAALLAARIEMARRRRLRLLVAETGERGSGQRDVSYRNLLGAGFHEVCVRPFWCRDR